MDCGFLLTKHIKGHIKGDSGGRENGPWGWYEMVRW